MSGSEMPGKDSDSKKPDNSDSNMDKNEDPCKYDLKDLPIYDRKLMRGVMRGFSKVMMLWLISKKRQHGYEIMTQIHESVSYDTKMPSASMIYPVLHYLEKKGMICGTWEHQGKRKVKYYEITTEGEESLDRIRKLAVCGQEYDSNHIWDEFMEDMFGLKRV
jgi:DNA-binding PadR family transcriptional regulator